MQETLDLAEKIWKIPTLPTKNITPPALRFEGGAGVLVAQAVRALSQLLFTLNVQRWMKHNCKYYGQIISSLYFSQSGIIY